MILVDSSVWVDYFRGMATREADVLDALLDNEPLATGDLILAEVLQGFRSDRDFDRARSLLTSLTVVELGGRNIAVQAARNFRSLRRWGSPCARPSTPSSQPAASRTDSACFTATATSIHSCGTSACDRRLPDRTRSIPATLRRAQATLQQMFAAPPGPGNMLPPLRLSTG
jgi:predicted nucleic acid-binding protein